MSPTVLREDGFRLVIYTRDHDPAHVHVFKAENEAVIDIVPHVSVRNSWGYNQREVNRITQIVADNVGHLRSEWSRIHHA